MLVANRFKEIKAYQCIDCEKVYTTPPPTCRCRSRIKVGDVIGVFRVEEILRYSKCRVTCLACGTQTELYNSNIRRQKSCGCVPRHIKIKSVGPITVKYFCKKCNTYRVYEHPIEKYCCE